LRNFGGILRPLEVGYHCRNITKMSDVSMA
jgi:hypothetical protein